MFPIRLRPKILLSPSPETEALSLERIRSENRVLFHGVCWAAFTLYLLSLNLLLGGLSNPWSLYPAVAWGAVLAVHILFVGYLGRRSYEKKHRQLFEAWREASGRGIESSSEIEVLRERLLDCAQAARQSLRPISPETAADVSRGEAKALEMVAWLDEAHPLLQRASEARDLRQEVATALSKPVDESDRAPLETLLAQLDRQDVKLAALEREADRRRSLLESFFLVLDSAAVAGSSTDVLAAVSDPLRDRVRLLEEAVGAEVTGVAGLEEPAVDTGRIREEVRLAQELQKSILPRRAPEVAGLSVAHFYRPSSEVGGDFFDFYATGPGRLLVAVGDASGHGLDSSMMSSMVKSALYTHVSANRSLDESMVEMNRMLCDTVGRRRLVTLALMELDVETRRISWVNAGHVFPLLARGKKIVELEQSTYPLGVRREVAYPVVEEDLRPGDRIVLVTDGCVEAVDPHGEVYGWERLGARLSSLAGSDSQQIVEGLAEDLWRHVGGEAPQDDVALVVVAFEPG